MTTLKTQIEISADASGVETGVSKAKRSLKDLGSTAQSVGKQGADGLSTIGDGGKQAAQKVDSATKNMIAAIQRQIAVTEAGSRSGADYYRVLASQRGVDTGALKPFLDQLDAVTAKQKQAQQSLAGAIPVLDRVGNTSKQTAAALRGVPAQLTDIVTSLQAGQSPLTVFLQQGGQLKDMFGGIGPAAKALGGYVLGLVNPLTLAAGAAGALVLAYHQGSKEADAYAKSLILTGNAAGLTTDQIQMMAERIGAVSATQSEASAALAEFAASSNISSNSMEKFAAVAVRMQKEAGQAVSETVKQFAELGKEPVAASIKLNETTRFLTAEIYNQIKALDDQGKSAEAAAVAQNAYAEVMNSRMDQLKGRLGTIEKLWKDIAFGAKLAWDAMLDIGRPDTNFEKINSALDVRSSLEKQLQSAEKYGDQQRATYLRNQLEGNKTLINSLRAKGEAEKAAAAKQKADADQTSGKVRLDKYLDDTKYADNKTRMGLDIQKENAEFAAATKNFAKDSKEYETAFARHKSNLAKINEQYRDKAGARLGLQIDKSQLSSDIDSIKNASEVLLNTYNNAEKVMEALRSAGMVGDSDYYESKRAFIRLESEAKEEALRQEIARLQKEQLAGKDRIDNDKKIADAQAKIAILKANSASQLQVLGIQEESAANRLKNAFLTARQAAQDYFDTIQRQQARDLASAGMSERDQIFNSGVNQIEDRYSGQRRDLENQKAQLELEGKFTDEARKQYEARLSIINEFQSKSIASFADYYAKLIEQQGDWSLGASKALKDYYNDSQNIMAQTKKLFTDVFNDMEDALVDFVMTGKLSFKDLADSIVADITRIIIKQQITGPLANMLQTGMGSGGGLGGAISGFFGSLFGRAIGGPVSAGGMYEVNEKGRPELLQVAGKQYLMMGNQGGKVDANPQSGGSTTILHVNVTPPQNTSRATAKQWGADAGRSMQAAIRSNG